MTGIGDGLHRPTLPVSGRIAVTAPDRQIKVPIRAYEIRERSGRSSPA